MRKPHISICPEGAQAIGLTGFSALLFAILGCWPAAILFWLLCWFSLHFFRDPDRVIPQEPDLAVCPADGKVIAIQLCEEPFKGERRQRISIFMNVFNVHVNRAPVACAVTAIRYWPGKFFNASLDKASADNERCSWLLTDEQGNVWVMTQIAGLIARRIVCRAEVGDHLARGQRVGMIRFGSRVDLYLPEVYTPAVKIGDKVLAGQTVIARKNLN